METVQDIFGGALIFANPWGFIWLLLIPLGYWLFMKFGKATMLYTVTRRFKRIPSSFRVKLWKSLPHLWAIVILLFSLSAARPQAGQEIEKVYTEGIDIVITFDISSSMLAVDFKPKNRIEAAKIEAENFVKGRTNDRIGLVIFSSKAFPQCPLTIDHQIVQNLLRQVGVGMIEDGTAIGDAIICAANRLRKSEAKSKVMILLTDGRNNTGRVEPGTAAQAAAALGIKIHTIGMGKLGKAPYPVQDAFGRTQYVPMDVEIDEPTLREIATITGGQYFRATDSERLRSIYAEIDQMEKTKVETQRFKRYKELYSIPLTLGFLLMSLVVFLEYVVVRQIP